MSSHPPSVVDDPPTHVPHEACRIIRAMLTAECGVFEPKSFQIEMIYMLAFKRTRALLMQKTGAGKSLVVLGAASLLCGVTIVLEPLVAVGSDQSRAADEQFSRIEAYHVEGLDDTTRDLVIERLLEMNDRSEGPCVLYLGPSALAEDSSWVAPLKKLFERGLVTLVAVDEVHKCTSDGRYFRRDEFQNLRRLWTFLDLSPKKVAQLSMTATLTKQAKNDYRNMYGTDFEFTQVGDMSRRDMSLHCAIVPVPTIEMKNVVKRHLVSDPTRKVIVVTNEAQAAKVNVSNALTKVIESDADIVGDVMVVTGDSGIVWKTFVMEEFSREEPTALCHLRALVGTSAINCGVSSRLCGLSLYHGLPDTIDSYAQVVGRAGRTDLKEGALAFESHVVMNVASFTFLVSRINDVPCPAERSVLTESALESLALMVIPNMCVHLFLESRYGGVSKRPNSSA